MRICSDHRPSPKHPLNQWFPTLREIGCGTAGRRPFANCRGVVPRSECPGVRQSRRIHLGALLLHRAAGHETDLRASVGSPFINGPKRSTKQRWAVTGPGLAASRFAAPQERPLRYDRTLPGALRIGSGEHRDPHNAPRHLSAGPHCRRLRGRAVELRCVQRARQSPGQRAPVGRYRQGRQGRNRPAELPRAAELVLGCRQDRRGRGAAEPAASGQGLSESAQRRRRGHGDRRSRLPTPGR